MFHTGSARLAHHLDRFASGPSLEELAGEAARLGVEVETIRQYLARYGEQMVVVKTRHGPRSMPAYEFFIRKDLTGPQH
jgi:hypothetical protein